MCWIDPDYDRAYASDGQSRYGAYVRDYPRLFDPWQDAPDGVTVDVSESGWVGTSGFSPKA